ncbi:MAG: 50S ribosomal protein L23 [bacterium]|nr:50S ribosomal protein L23 [bacterium]
MEQSQIIIKPIITEKSMRDAASGWYTFAVLVKANKGQIGKAVKEQFKVNVLAVRTLTMKGKTKRVGRRRAEIKLSPWKKAIVRLGPEQKIDLFEVNQ